MIRERYIFREITKDEIPQMFLLILKRIQWMDQKGIQQWNTTGYAKTYPQSYYEEERLKGRVFVLVDKTSDEIVSAAVLKEEDERWTDSASSIYLHNLVTKVGQGGVGSLFLQFAEKYATEKGKQYFRLDSAENNDFLKQYYTLHGFLPVGRCVDGPYRGILRQKKLPR